ncbi:MAG: class I SAM-dependent methyltransferase [Thermodesulfovibrionia bacterium]|nr:class I SAM-dependent methyltransferase [Thermodesulfovibrionia bacterium]
MDELSKEYVISYYSKSLNFHGDTPAAVKWTGQGQLLRFESLLNLNGDISGCKVLDYGCGKGDFYQFLTDMGIDVDYVGFDINKDMVALARRKFPQCRFEIFDIEKDTLDEDFDYIFLCGVFNLKLEGIYETVKNVLSRLFKHCRHTLVFNALSSHDPRKDFELHYISPEDIYDFAAADISPYVALRQNKGLYDFNLFIYKSDKH